MKFRLATLATSAVLVAGLSACASDPYGPNYYPTSSVTPIQSAPSSYVEYGRITNVSMINPGTRVAGNTTAGTIAGAVVGGVLGSTIGGGSGRAVATILGAVGGAAIGSRLQANQNGMYNTAGPVHRVSVTTDQGMTREYDVSASSDLRVGDRVRIENGVIYMG
ncbi:glycine zipper 2TM domain-containing protein [Caenimonas sp. SL110]|uniref:glycine zipper 2TM domain-containing protein n=1 Tax=Caenimonas sp. SL110 TaxID=1450524 RepID=UPI0006533C29|nr:glycine zipper 2TM domain-containing protein [Caenimonas sp. SL110]